MTILSFTIQRLAVVLLFAGLAYGIGHRLVPRVDFDSFEEELSICTGLGLGVLSLVLFSMGLFGLIHWVPALVLLAALVAAALRPWQGLLRRIRDQRPWHLGPKQWLSYALLAAPIAPMAVAALYPPHFWDAIMYHLPFAKAFVQEHRIVTTPYLRYALSPQLQEVLFAWMLLLSDDIAAQCLQFCMMLLTTLALIAWGRRLASPTAGIWSGALWLANPLVIWLGISAYIDIGLALYCTLACLALWNWRSTGMHSWLVLAAVYSGFAAGSKYSAFFVIAALGLICITESVRQRSFGPALLYAAVTVAVASPWYVRNLLVTGDPFFPWGGPIFGYSFSSPPDLAGHVAAMARKNHEQTLLSFLRLPWDLVFHQSTFHREAPLSRIWIVALPALLLLGARRKATRTILFIASLYVFLWFFSLQQLHYLVPILPLWSLLTSVLILDPLLARLRCLPRNSLVVAALGFFILSFSGWWWSLSFIRDRGPVPVLSEERDAFLAARLPSYPAYRLLNDRHGSSYRLYALFDENMAYFADGVFMGDWFGPGRYQIIDTAMQVGGSQGLYRALRQMKATHFLVSGGRKRIDLPVDQFFREQFVLISHHPTVLLFELRPPQGQTPSKRRIEPN
jgi:hypothetical protein